MTQDPRCAHLLTFPIFLHSQTPAVTQFLQYPNLASRSWYKSLLQVSWVPSSASLEHHHPAEEVGQLPQRPWLPPCWSSPCTLLQLGSPSLCDAMAHNGTHRSSEPASTSSPKDPLHSTFPPHRQQFTRPRGEIIPDEVRTEPRSQVLSWRMCGVPGMEWAEKCIK